MTHSDDWNSDMVLLDHDTADRLVRGAVAPDDAPPGYAEVAALLGELRDEPVVVDDRQIAMFTAAVQSSVASRTRVRMPRRRRRIPAAIAGGVAIAMLVAPVAARIARDIDRGRPDDAPVVVTPQPASSSDAGGKGEPPRRASATPAKQRSNAPSTPAADNAAVTVPVASDAPPTPSVYETPTASTDGAPVTEAPADACEHGADASAKDGRPCPGEKRAPATEDSEPRRGGPER